MKNISTWLGILLCLVLIGASSILWAWLGKEISSATISRGFLVGGLLAMLFGVANLRISYGFVNQNSPSYSTAFYDTLKTRTRLMFSDMAEHSSWTKVLLISGFFSLIIAFLVFRFL